MGTHASFSSCPPLPTPFRTRHPVMSRAWVCRRAERAQASRKIGRRLRSRECQARQSQQKQQWEA